MTSKDAVRVFDARDFGRALRAGRRRQKLTQMHAAQLAGVSSRLWSELESGKRPQVGLETALRMAQTLGIDLVVAERGNRTNSGL